MRFIPFLALVLALGVAVPAAAQSVGFHAAAKTGSTAGAIIPGSPLAALTGASPPSAAPADVNAPAPFGTEGIGLSLTSAIGAEADKASGAFISAIRQSIRVTPILDWLKSFSVLPFRRTHLVDIAMALIITILPGLGVEAAVRLGLAWPQRGLVRRAAARQLAPPADEEEGAQGLADAEAGETERRPRRRESLLAWGGRLLFGLLHFGLMLLPLTGFALTVQSLISAGLLTTRPANLAVIGIANAYLFCRIVLAILSFLTAPGAPPLRLVSLPTRHAAWFMRRAWLLLGTGFFGYAVVSVAEILGLPDDGALVLIRLLELVIDIEIVVAIWQSRRLVAGWIAGRADAAGVLPGLRHRLAHIWHYLALFYVLALWVAWAGGVQNALLVLLRVVLVFLAALIFGRLAWSGSSILLARAFPDPETRSESHPVLFVRAHAYNPLLRALVRILIGALVILLILQGWGMDAFGWLLTDPFSRSLISALISIVITIAAALTLWECTDILINRRLERLSNMGRTRNIARLRTLLPMLKASIGVSLFLVAGLICLSKIGVNAAPLLAGAGVLGIAIGFGSQKLVQDIITGLFLLLEDAMQVGDVVSLAGLSGTVERLSIRTIHLRGGDGSINIIPFSAVTTVTNMTRDFGCAQISIEVGYKENLTVVYAVLADIADTMRQDPIWGLLMQSDLQIFGLDRFGATSLVITGQIRTGPGQHWAVRREFYARVKTRFEAEHIEIPYTDLSLVRPRRVAEAGEEGK